MGRRRNRQKQRRKQRKAAKKDMAMQTKSNSTTKTTTPAKKSCHSHPAAAVFAIKEDFTLYAGSKYSIIENIEKMRITPKLVVDLSGMVIDSDLKFDSPISMNQKAKAILPKTLTKVALPPSPGLLAVDWDDGGVPFGLDRAWWDALASALMELEGDVTINCIGGHGRTGTMLAILSHLWGVCEDQDPIEFVRDVYCDRAVETPAQVRYIERILGIKSDAKGSDAGWFGSSNWGNREQAATAKDDSTTTTASGRKEPYSYRTVGGGLATYDPTTGITTYEAAPDDTGADDPEDGATVTHTQATDSYMRQWSREESDLDIDEQLEEWRKEMGITDQSDEDEDYYYMTKGQ